VIGEPVGKELHGVRRDVLADGFEVEFGQPGAKGFMLGHVLLKAGVAGRFQQRLFRREVASRVVLQPGDRIGAEQRAFLGGRAVQLGEPAEDGLVLLVEQLISGAEGGSPFDHRGNGSRCGRRGGDDPRSRSMRGANADCGPAAVGKEGRGAVLAAALGEPAQLVAQRHHFADDDQRRCAQVGGLGQGRKRGQRAGDRALAGLGAMLHDGGRPVGRQAVLHQLGAQVNTKINQTQIDQLNIVCQANYKARNLVNEPVNKLNATDLSNAFKQMGKEAGFKVEVYNKTKIKQLKMGGLLSVNAGSVDEPTFTIMEYKPSKAKNKKPYVLVGKGVVYDTGGLSLKPTAGSMDSMKCDMAGAAAVSCAMYAIAKAKLNVHVIALVPATDNRPGFNAFAPGDIITMMDGSTVEMLNSDAEGRMILADALHFAKKYNPELVIDMATLTGAALAAIGSFAMVGMGTASDNVKKKLHETGFAVNERIAEFPFWDDYNDLLKSDIADQKNIGGPYGGSITAGKFLQKFTNYPYFHLDIAGPAFIAAKDSYRGKGGTGWGVRFLFDFFKTI
jgi:leucyl aminopeptidase